MATTHSTTSKCNIAGAEAANRAALSLTPKCQFGVTVFEGGTMAELKTGKFTADQAEEIARRLVVLASAVRNAARNTAA